MEILPVHNTTQYLYLVYNFGNFISVNESIPRAIWKYVNWFPLDVVYLSSQNYTNILILYFSYLFRKYLLFLPAIKFRFFEETILFSNQLNVRNKENWNEHFNQLFYDALCSNYPVLYEFLTPIANSWNLVNGELIVDIPIFTIEGSCVNRTVKR